MKIFVPLTAFFFLSLTMAFGQSDCNHAENYKNRITIDDTKLEVVFDLPANGSHRFFNVNLQTSSDDVRPKTYISGTGDNIQSGNDKRITWYFQRDGYTKSQVSPLRFWVDARDPLENCAEEQPAVARRGIPPTAGLGIAGATGLTLITTGAITAGNAKNSDAYEAYESNQDPNDPVWSNLGYNSREDLYDDQNSKYKRGQILALGGAAVLVAGGAIFINRLIQNKKMMKNSLGYEPRIKTFPVVLTVPANLALPGVGMGVSYRF